jgi:hypothetical protein
MVSDYLDDDYSLQALLDFNEIRYYIKGGYWIKFEVWRVKPTKYVPHGIKYSITLHDSNNIRIVGYDNAHTCLPKAKKYKAKKVTWDHVHKKERVYPYEFDSASQLIEDFWNTVKEFV